jgi:hypothetical protein
MQKATRTILATAALMLSAGAYAQSNNSLARPSVTSPVAVAVAPTNGYGTPGTTGADSGGPSSQNPGTSTSNTTAAPSPTVWKSNNSLARPSVASPAAGQ